jgi:hypothetical protein
LNPAGATGRFINQEKLLDLAAGSGSHPGGGGGVALVRRNS